MTRPFSHKRLIPNTLVGVAALAFAAASPMAWGEDHRNNEIPFAEAEIFFELNNTDGDLGIHALIDGDPWKGLKIEDPKEREILDLRVKRRLRRQGLTELFFESAEPPFESDDPDEVTLTPEEFFKRFREGTYEIEGKTLEGEELESKTEVTHLMPAPPQPTVNEQAFATECDPDDPNNYDPSLVAPMAPTVTIEWPAVTMSHPDLGNSNKPVTIVNYEVVVENVGAVDAVLSVILPPTETSFVVPDEFIALGNAFKYEVLAREESFNQTATESCFLVGEALM